MSEVMIMSRTGRITIPRSVVEVTGWRPGDKFVAVVKGGSVTLVPVEELGASEAEAVRKRVATGE